MLADDRQISTRGVLGTIVACVRPSHSCKDGDSRVNTFPLEEDHTSSALI